MSWYLTVGRGLNGSPSHVSPSPSSSKSLAGSQLTPRCHGDRGPGAAAASTSSSKAAEESQAAEEEEEDAHGCVGSGIQVGCVGSGIQVKDGGALGRPRAEDWPPTRIPRAL